MNVPPLLLQSLDAIYRLPGECPRVSAVHLAERLGVELPQAEERTGALEGMGLLGTETSGRIVFTPEGERLALGLMIIVLSRR